jgi:hypothetical protein
LCLCSVKINKNPSCSCRSWDLIPDKLGSCKYSNSFPAGLRQIAPTLLQAAEPQRRWNLAWNTSQLFFSVWTWRGLCIADTGLEGCSSFWGKGLIQKACCWRTAKVIAMTDLAECSTWDAGQWSSMGKCSTVSRANHVLASPRGKQKMSKHISRGCEMDGYTGSIKCPFCSCLW